MATKKQIAQIIGGAIIAAEKYYRESTIQLLARAKGFMQGAGIDKPEYDNLTIAQALEKRDEAIKHKINDIKVKATRIGMEAAQATQSENGNNGKPTKTRNRIKHIPYKQALAILERLNCPKDRKTLQRWIKGENTPDDFTPERMATIEAFTAWARIYANREQSKINTNNALRIDNPNSRKMQKFR